MLPFSLASKLLDTLGLTGGYRLGSTQADLDHEGLRPTVQPWEDGRRTGWRRDEFEWWYFDAHFEDGSMAVGTYALTWKENDFVFMVRMAITGADGTTHKKVVELRKEQCHFLRGECSAVMGPHRLEGDGTRYRIVADPSAAGGLGWDLTLERRVAPYRPASGVIYGGRNYFAWVNAVPDGAIAGTLTYGGRTVTVRGTGYHDHNWGDTAMNQVMSGWVWGRVRVGDYAVVAANVVGQRRFGDPPVPLMLVTHPDGVVVDAFGADVTVEQRDVHRHPDPENKEDDLPRTVRYTAREGNLTASLEFRAGKLVESLDLVHASEVGAHPWQMALADVAGLTPWYTRVLAECTFTLGNEAPVTATGTLEYMDFS